MLPAGRKHMGCTWGERWSMSHPGHEGVKGEPGFKPYAVPGAKTIPSGYIESSLQVKKASLLDELWKHSHVSSTVSMEQQAKLDALIRTTLGKPHSQAEREAPERIVTPPFSSDYTHLADELRQLGRMQERLYYDQRNAQKSQSSALLSIMSQLETVTSQLVMARQQLELLSERLAQLEERQQEAEKRTPADPFATGNTKRTRKIKRIAQ